MVTMHKVKSSSIESVGHDGQAMHIRFASGHEYRYEGVNAEQFEALKSAESVGKHFQKHVAGKLKGVKVEKAKKP